MAEKNVTDFEEVTVYRHREDRNIAVVEFDIGDGNSHCMVTSPANLKTLAIRMYAAARAILGESKQAGERFN